LTIEIRRCASPSPPPRPTPPAPPAPVAVGAGRPSGADGCRSAHRPARTLSPFSVVLAPVVRLASSGQKHGQRL